MTTTQAVKKPATEQDWHWADVLAALRKQGWSLRQIAKKEGYKTGAALGEAARRPYPKVERILAAYAGIAHPMEIWPSRYTKQGLPNRKSGPKSFVGRRPVARAAAPFKPTTKPTERVFDGLEKKIVKKLSKAAA